MMLNAGDALKNEVKKERARLKIIANSLHFNLFLR